LARGLQRCVSVRAWAPWFTSRRRQETAAAAERPLPLRGRGVPTLATLTRAPRVVSPELPAAPRRLGQGTAPVARFDDTDTEVDAFAPHVNPPARHAELDRDASIVAVSLAHPLGEPEDDADVYNLDLDDLIIDGSFDDG
jgi:hypothetical protein